MNVNLPQSSDAFLSGSSARRGTDLLGPSSGVSKPRRITAKPPAGHSSFNNACSNSLCAERDSARTVPYKRRRAPQYERARRKFRTAYQASNTNATQRLRESARSCAQDQGNQTELKARLCEAFTEDPNLGSLFVDFVRARDANVEEEHAIESTELSVAMSAMYVGD